MRLTFKKYNYNIWDQGPERYDIRFNGINAGYIVQEEGIWRVRFQRNKVVPGDGGGSDGTWEWAHLSVRFPDLGAAQEAIRAAQYKYFSYLADYIKEDILNAVKKR
ncbi:MAG: hypothetical protein FWG17_05110 [Desulfovibrionaceae bacterium]|nr:hypothetical protein [Desulfovibrionaceae bacterium]